MNQVICGQSRWSTVIYHTVYAHATCTPLTFLCGVLPMSTANQITGPSLLNDNFSVIFQAALSKYKTVTGKSLRAHPFATQLDSCDSPQAISTVLRAQFQVFGKFRGDDEKLMTWLDPIVHILSTLSTTLGERIIGLVS